MSKCRWYWRCVKKTILVRDEDQIRFYKGIDSSGSVRYIIVDRPLGRSPIFSEVSEDSYNKKYRFFICRGFQVKVERVLIYRNEGGYVYVNGKI